VSVGDGDNCSSRGGRECSRGALLGLKRAWPTSASFGHCRTEAEEEGSAATGEEDGTTGAAEGEIAAG
jgi:hypothetical protein